MKCPFSSDVKKAPGIVQLLIIWQSDREPAEKFISIKIVKFLCKI